MEEKINIAAILKDKQNGLRLYSPIFGDCTFCYVREDTNDICVKKQNGVIEYFNSEGLYFAFGEVMLFPSKSMRDWEKFSWKRGDVLISDCGFVCIFKEWASDDYTRFNGCYFDGMPNAPTAKYSKLDNNTAYGYVREIEKKLGGILNLKTLEIEKTQPEFKDGDIVTIINGCEQRCILIFRNIIGDSLNRYCILTKRGLFTEGYSLIDKEDSLLFATEEEKNKLFSALEKEGKAWDSEKKQIVDLKPKVDELKPFDKVLVRDGKDEIWEPAFFFRNLSQFNGYNYQTLGGEWRVYCVPYIGNESLLGTTKDVEG